MVYHNLSMSLNHHVPIFICTVTERGGLFMFTLMWGAVTVHFCTNNCPEWLFLVLLHVPFNPSPHVTSPVLGHVTLLYISWALWSQLRTHCLCMYCTLQMLYIKAIHDSVKNLWTTQPWSSYVCFLHSLSEGQMHPPPASCNLKLTLCWLVMNAKITHVTWRIILYTLFIHVSLSRPLYASTHTWRNAMYVFWLRNQAKSQGKP